MGKYENGSNTRRLILDVSIRLFLEKGFHETSYDDICHAAHVNRGSIYYHFKEKSNIRYEVLWELVIKNRNFVRQRCPETQHDILLAIYVLWKQFFEDARIRKFFLDYFDDQPVYSSGRELGHFYRTLYNQMYENIWDIEKIDDLSFASFYGHLHGIIQLIDANPSLYNADSLFWHAYHTSTAAYGMPAEKVTLLEEQLSEEIRLLTES